MQMQKKRHRKIKPNTSGEFKTTRSKRDVGLIKQMKANGFTMFYYRLPNGRILQRRRPLPPTLMSLSGAEQFDPEFQPQRR